jgi:hypothetical protein
VFLNRLCQVLYLAAKRGRQGANVDDEPKIAQLFGRVLS